MNGRFARLNRDLNVIEAGLNEPMHKRGIRQAAAVRVEARDLAQRLGMRDQVRKVGSQRGLAAGEHNVGHSELPEPIKDPFPRRGIQLGEIPRSGVIAVCAIVVAAIRQRKIHSVGRAGAGSEGHVHVEAELVNRACPIGPDQLVEALAGIRLHRIRPDGQRSEIQMQGRDRSQRPYDRPRAYEPSRWPWNSGAEPDRRSRSRSPRRMRQCADGCGSCRRLVAARNGGVPVRQTRLPLECLREADPG